MQIVTDFDKNFDLEHSVTTIGTFDGLHAGHYEIIDTLKAKSRELGLPSVVITFFPHPRTIVAKNSNLKLLTPLQEKEKIFEKLGVEYLFVVNFTEEFSKKSYKEFFEEVLINKVNTKFLIIGYDHKFGKGRDGDIHKLTEYTKSKKIGLSIVGPKKIDDEIVSSTKIRDALLRGEVDSANKMLGRNYSIESIVVHGAKRGRTLGFPTANLGPKDDNKLVPSNGVYLVNVKIDNAIHFGVANIGLRPTFNHVKIPITEVFILDFDKDIYGKFICLEFIKRIRDEKKFSSKEELEENIKLDVKEARKLLAKINK